MDIRKKYLICFSVSLLILQVRCTDDSVLPTAIPAEIENKLPPTVNPIPNPPTIQPDISDEAKYQPQNETTKVDSSKNENLNADDLIEPNSSTSEVIPLEFQTKLPADDDNASEKTSDELDDLQHGDNDQQGPISQIEWIEDDEEDVDNERAPLVQAMVDKSLEDDYKVQGQMGIVVALFLTVFLVTGYVAFVIWKRFIERRYGNREVLINEEDMIDRNDMKHFSL
ncbi:hypothetical protein Trydic_g10211 [Trypoxylus dichotomus]